MHSSNVILLKYQVYSIVFNDIVDLIGIFIKEATENGQKHDA